VNPTPDVQHAVGDGRRGVHHVAGAELPLQRAAPRVERVDVWSPLPKYTNPRRARAREEHVERSGMVSVAGAMPWMRLPERARHGGELPLEFPVSASRRRSCHPGC